MSNTHASDKAIEPMTKPLGSAVVENATGGLALLCWRSRSSPRRRER
jgi:hypothetical protein